MTCNSEMGREASSFVNAVTGFSQPQQFRTIEAAPIGLRKRLLGLIESEIDRKQQGQRASITAKLNSLVDPRLIAALYRASQAGVTVRLNIRGACCLRPGVPGLSERITVVSIIDRLLEHARIVCFHHGGDNLMFISSADWMPRNLDKRVELLVPVSDPYCNRRLMSILETYFQDNSNSWYLTQEGQYVRSAPKPGEPAIRSQKVLYDASVDAVKQSELQRRTVFEPHQPASKQTAD
jgi:polyphosphate kinase